MFNLWWCDMLRIDLCCYGLIRMKSDEVYSLTTAAKSIGISPATLKRWLLRRKVEEVSRDRNGWRVFTASDIIRIKKYAQKLVPPKRKE